MHPSHKVLFEPVRIGPVTTRNRFYQVPHGPGAGNFPQIDAGIRGMRAAGGWGVVCTESCSIHPTSDYNFLSMRRLWNDAHISELALTADAIHCHNSLAGIELTHFGLSAFNMNSHAPVLGPSRSMALGGLGAFPTQAIGMARSDIRELLTWQKLAAIRAKKAGFDIIYVYAAHNLSIISNFLSPRFNKRTDEYGGNLENRTRLLREMIEVTRDAVGDRCAVAVRFSVDELRGLDGITFDREGRQVVEMLAELPDVWDVNVSDWANDSRSSRFASEGWQEDYISFVKQCTTKPVVGVGRFTSPDTMSSHIRRGVLDLIGAARPSIADPFLPVKIEEGRSDEIRECIGCNHCIKTMNHGLVSNCTQNPTMGEEWRLGWHPERIAPRSSSETVLVVGAGPAGLEATRALVQRGYSVILAEADVELGGRVRREAALPRLNEYRRVIDWRISQIQTSPLVETYRSSLLSADDILNVDCDRIVIATGSKWRRDGIGVLNHVAPSLSATAKIFTPDDIMSGSLPDAGPVVVFDDDHQYLGAAVAELLAARGLKTIFVTTGHMVSKYTEAALEARDVLASLQNMGIEIRVHTFLKEVFEDHVICHCAMSMHPDRLEAASVVLVTSREPSCLLYSEIVGRPEVQSFGRERIQLIGDANSPGTIAAAIFEGHRYARELGSAKIDIAELAPSSRSLY